MRKPIRAVAVIIKNNQLLLIRRVSQGKQYYVFPGGGVEDNETVENAVLRELREETSIVAKIRKLIYHHHIIGETNDSDQYFYLCDYNSGVPQLSESNELEENKKGIDFYEPLWYPVDKLSQTLLYPLEIRDWLLSDLTDNFSETPREETIKMAELRQTL